MPETCRPFLRLLVEKGLASLARRRSGSKPPLPLCRRRAREASPLRIRTPLFRGLTHAVPVICFCGHVIISVGRSSASEITGHGGQCDDGGQFDRPSGLHPYERSTDAGCAGFAVFDEALTPRIQTNFDVHLIVRKRLWISGSDAYEGREYLSAMARAASGEMTTCNRSRRFASCRRS